MAVSLWTIPFGKHKGEDIEDVDDEYLEWLLEQDWFESKFSKGFAAVRKEIDYRNKWGTK